MKQNKNKVILHFISGIKSGGVEQFLINYSPYLIENGFVVYVAYQHEAHAKSLVKLENAGCICIRLANKRKHPIKNLIDSIKLIKKINPDIVECHQDLANFFPLIAARFSGSKVRIAHIHSSNTDVNMPKLILRFMKYLIKVNATQRVACSTNAGNFVYGNLSFNVIPNAINMIEYRFNHIDRQKYRAMLKLTDTFVIGHVGRLTRAKNHIRLFSIFQEIKKHHENAKLLLIGGGELEQELKHAAKVMNLSNYIIFLGETNNVEKYYSVMDIMILPSLYEGGPIAAIEGQANGLSMVLSNKVDPSVEILKSTKLLSLQATNHEWFYEIEKLRMVSRDRMNDNLQMQNTDFNIEHGKVNLFRFYRFLLSEEEKV
ncbi:glycosyltransferase [Leuconostoc gasicomitatum]|uniref:glycosyltransferase n=1 Tax=Leuconostoc gasicomitatum TaxID=115778 RepID=UPI001CC4CE72|nr:glycosyltransferase [Leuconostoc gasicomitatum]MBZ5981188.1 glycosyltransferase [Leuconostoc gasicomitatum]